MQYTRFGQICELSYRYDSGPSLPHLVRDLGDRLGASGLADVNLTWDCDDIALFEIPGHRIILAIADRPSAEVASKLLISVGPSPQNQDGRPIRLSHAALCRRIVRGLEQKYSAHQRRMRSFPGVLLPERVDDILYSTAVIAERPNQAPQLRSTRPRTSIADDARLRAAVTFGKTGNARKFFSAGLLVNGISWSIARAAQAVVLATLGTNMVGKLVWASATQLPR
jgi:hypothetical protein